MQIEIRHSPAFASATLTLAPNEQIKAEAGAMVYKSAATGTIVAALSILTAWVLNRVLFNRFEAIRHSSAGR